MRGAEGRRQPAAAKPYCIPGIRYLVLALLYIRHQVPGISPLVHGCCCLTLTLVKNLESVVTQRCWSPRNIQKTK